MKTPEQGSITPQAVEPLVTTDLRLAAAACACQGTLASVTKRGRLLEFTVSGLPPGWFQAYLNGQLRADPALVNRWSDHFAATIRKAFPRNQEGTNERN